MASSISLPRVGSGSPLLERADKRTGRSSAGGDRIRRSPTGALREMPMRKHTIGRFPNIIYFLWAILIGLVISNTMTIPKLFQSGIDTYEFWLKLGIVLLGSRFVLADVLKLGGISLGLVVIEITLSLALMTLLGRLFKLKPKLTSLLAIGSAVCGVSAIIAAKGAIDADDEDSSFAIAAILALGALSLFTFPAIAHSLHMNDVSYGLWAGLGIDNTAEATAAGALYSDAAGKVAVLAKTTSECHDWICCSGVRDLLGWKRPGRGRP